MSLRKQSVQDSSPDDIHVVNPKSAWKKSKRISFSERGGKQVRDEFNTH